MHRSTRLVAGLATAALVSGGALVAAQPSEAAAGAAAVKRPVDCPTAYPVGKVVKGLKGTGFTVETGTAPAAFTATVLGRISNGLAPGVDLIVAKISSPAVSRAHGIWAGISGSPVYSSDGRLIGSVSYGLGTNSDVAGLTPAATVLGVLAGAPKAAAKAKAATPARVSLSGAQRQELAAAGAGQAAAASGFTRVPLPVTVSGKPTKRVLDYLAKLPDVRVVNGGGHASGAAVKPTAIHAGGNFVAALSYGDYTVAAVGTTTAVCKGKAVAFGHPFLGDGPTQLTAHSASAVEVQPDSLFGAYKIANPGGVVGVVDQDLNHGIRAVLGAKPAHTTVVTTSVKVGSKKAVKGSTTVLYAPAVGNIAANHVYGDLIEAIGYEGRGSASATLVIKGVRGNGKPFTLSRADVYADPNDLPFTIADRVFQFTEPLVEQEFENLRITSISLTATVSSAVHRYTVSKVQANEGGSWVTLGSSPVPATPGGSIALRVTLTPYKGVGAAKVVPLNLKVPADATDPLALVVRAGSQDVDVSDAANGDELLKSLASVPPNDSVRAALIAPGPTGDVTVSSASTRVGTAIGGYGNFFDVSLPGGGPTPGA